MTIYPKYSRAMADHDHPPRIDSELAACIDDAIAISLTVGVVPAWVYLLKKGASGPLILRVLSGGANVRCVQQQDKINAKACTCERRTSSPKNCELDVEIGVNYCRTIGVTRALAYMAANGVPIDVALRVTSPCAARRVTL